MKPTLLLTQFLICGNLLISQSIQDSLLLTEEGQFEYSSTFFSYNSLINRNDSPYVYSASTVLGMLTFDISDLSQPIPIDTIPTLDFNGHSVSGLYQEGDHLFVALGGIQSIFIRRPGLAILDISNPAVPSLIGIWDTTAFENGCAIVRVQDGYAYLGIMDGGVLILDIADPDSIRSVGHILPDPTFPDDLPYAPKARGLEVRDSLLFVAYDPGGIRAIDISDKRNPIEIGMYLHPGLDSIAQPAYNNIRLAGDYAFATVDYCGLDIIEISDPTDMHSVYWYNPWTCNGGSWFGSPGHSNELILTNHDSLLFMSGGDIELLVMEVSTPAAPVLLAEYGAVEDSAVSWGLDVWRDKIVLSLVDNSFLWTPILQPYYGDQGGIRTLSWERMTVPLSGASWSEQELKMFPNPASDFLHIQFPEDWKNYSEVEIRRVSGATMVRTRSNRAARSMSIETNKWAAGLYIATIRHESGVFTRKFLKR
ncbi:MAG: T9SS type A sorting domain-containing protein [Bacteroidota bacterium]